MRPKTPTSLIALFTAGLLGGLFYAGLQQFFSSSNIWQHLLLAALSALAGGALTLSLLSMLPALRQPYTEEPDDHRRIEAEIMEMEQKLGTHSPEDTAQIARLNVELQLQMAMLQQAKEAALTSEERFRAMADNVQEGLTILENGSPVYRNERACEIFGECPDGGLDSRILTFAAPEERPRLQEILRNGGGSPGGLHELDYWILRTDGSRGCVRERFSHSSNNGIQRTFIITSDITNETQAYQLMENLVDTRTQELSTILEVSQKIASTLELEPLLYLILDQIQKIIPYSGAAIFTLEESTLHAAAYQVPDLPYQKQALQLSVEQAGLFKAVVKENKVVIIDDVHGDTPLRRALQESGVALGDYAFVHARSWIGIPLVFHGQVTGLLSLAHDQPAYYTQRHSRLAMTITNQVAVAIENARLYEHAQNLAVIEERHRLARELHDSVTQLLYGIALHCTATKKALRGANQPQITQNLEEIKENALQALQEMRLLILELNPPLLQKAGLAAALKTSLEIIENRTGLQTEFTVDGITRLPRSLEADLYRIAMEALNNLVRYARAQQVRVELRAAEGWVWLEIYDNGIGFDPNKAHSSGGMGLQNMETRARKLGGKLEVISLPGAGTRILVEAPMFNNPGRP